MIRGSYKKKFSYPESPNAINSILESCLSFKYNGFSTCGTAAISALTGLSPSVVDRKKPKSAEHWSDRAITSFLKKRGFSVLPVSKYGVTNIDPFGDWEFFPLNKNHVFLLNSLFCRREASWIITTQNQWIHNFHAEAFTPFHLLNKPTQNVYLVSHKNWR